MKTEPRLTALLLCAVTIGCTAAITHFPPRAQAYTIDFQPHTRDGFFFSPNPFIESHKPLGLVTIELRAQADFKTESGMYYAAWHFKPIPVDSGLSLAKARVMELGGDALVNLQLRRSTDVVSAQLHIPTLEVSGLAIKRGPR